MKNNKPALNKQKIETKNDNDAQFLMEQHTTFAAPFPSPEDLEYYNKISPDFAERILKFIEDNAKHRKDKENIVIDATHTENMAIIANNKYGTEKNAELIKHEIDQTTKYRCRGQNFGFILTVLLIGGTITTALLEQTAVAIALCSGTIAQIVGSFLKNGNKNNGKNENK